MVFSMHFIDSNCPPVFIPDGWKIQYHYKHDSFIFDPANIKLSKMEPGIAGKTLMFEFKDKPVLNANVLDYLLEHQEVIPGSWKVDENGDLRLIYFWGTIYSEQPYRSGSTYLCVRFMYFMRVSDYWGWDKFWIDKDLGTNDFKDYAALRKI